MKRISLLVLVLVCLLTLSACGCKHETWNDATCDTPKTCAECGETEGAPLGHSWLAGTCVTPKTCEVCAATEGEAPGHVWVEATCETAKTCSTCGETEGEVPVHVWMDPTTEAPKTCEVCAKTEGEKVTTDPRFTTAATKDVQGVWVSDVEVTGEMMELGDMDEVLKCQLVMELKYDGTMNMHMDVTNQEEFNSALGKYMVNTLYAEFQAQGIEKEDADAAMMDAYGMSMEDYANALVASMDFASMFTAFNLDGVYYAEDGKLYSGMTWDADLEPAEYTLEGDTLTLEGDLSGTGKDNTVFKRAHKE